MASHFKSMNVRLSPLPSSNLTPAYVFRIERAGALDECSQLTNPYASFSASHDLSHLSVQLFGGWLGVRLAETVKSLHTLINISSPSRLTWLFYSFLFVFMNFAMSVILRFSHTYWFGILLNLF